MNAAAYTTPNTTPDTTAGTTIGAIILGGGRAKRMGGVQKADTLWQGRRFLDILQDGLETERLRLGLELQTVVVAPPAVKVRGGTLQTLEDPPFGGPVAGVGAGLRALGGSGAFSESGCKPEAILLLSCDAPFAASALGVFWPVWEKDSSLDVLTASWEESSRPMPALFSTLAIEAACADPKVDSLRGLYAGAQLRWKQLEVPEWMLQGANTVEEVAALRAPLG